MTPGQGSEGPSVNLVRVNDSCRKYLKLAEMGVQRSDAEGSAGIMRTGGIQPPPGTAPPRHISSDIGRSAVLILPLCATLAVYRVSNRSCQLCVVSVLGSPRSLVMALGSLGYSRLDFLRQTPVCLLLCCSTALGAAWRPSPSSVNGPPSLLTTSMMHLSP